MKIIIMNGRVIDPSSNIDEIRHVVIDYGRIEGLIRPNEPIDEDSSGFIRIDATDKIVVPGLIDMHVHLREPGEEYKEDIRSGGYAACAGGFTGVACMPNTKPSIDSRSVTEFIRRRAKEEGRVDVYPIGSLTKGMKGEDLSEIGELKEAGCVALSDDGAPIQNTQVMRSAMEYARSFDMPIIVHCEDKSLAPGWAMNEGFTSTMLGMPAQPNAAEDIMVSRNIMLAHLTGVRLHIAHVSTARAVELVRRAKGLGVPVTAEATPHHFTLTDETVASFDTNTKMSPPLRSEKDRDAVRKGLSDGTIDVIATDHAPHNRTEKEMEYPLAAFGIIGLETALALTMKLVEDGYLTISQAIAKLTINPSKILGLQKGTLSVGADADVTIIDPKEKYAFESRMIFSKSKNTPFIGHEMSGRVHYTIYGGKIVFELEKAKHG